MYQSSFFSKSKAFSKRVFSVALLLFGGAFLHSVVGQTAQEIIALEPDRPVERQIAGGEKDEFQIALAAGEYAKIVIEQRGINIFARLLDADGKTLIETDAEQRSRGTETVELYSPVAANLRLTVAPRQKSDRRAAYQITFADRHAASAKEAALDEARKAFSAANALWIAGKYAEALPNAERALAIRLRELGAEDSEVGRSYFVLGNVVGDQGDLAKCEAYYSRALEILEKSLGKEHLLISSVLNNWGVVHKDRGDYVKAEALYSRALEIREKNLEPNHLWIASSLNNLANISRLKNDSEKATAYYQRALTIRENALGPEHPDVATSLNNLANLSNDFAVVEPLHRRILAIREKVLGPDHQDVGQTLYNLALIYYQAGDYTKAEPFCRRSLAVFEKALGAEHQFVSYPLNLLGVIYLNTGAYDQSETMLLRAAALKEKTQNALHPELGGTYVNLASLYVLKGEIEKAIAAQIRANEILEYNTALNLRVGSEREKLQYLQTLKGVEYKTLTLNFQAAKSTAAATELAVTSVLRRKGRVLDAMSDSFGTLRRRADKQDQTLFDDLNETTNRLASFVMSGGRDVTPDEYRREIKTLEQKREVVEDQISRRNIGFYEPLKSVTLDQVRSLIPAKTALVEFAVYQPVSFRTINVDLDKEADSKTFGEARYAAFVINAKGETRGRDLGTAQEIDRLVDNLRLELRDPKSKNLPKAARAADAKIMQPLRELLGGAEHLLVSPDGDLNLIPFEALIDEQNHYLIENYSFTYLTSGRDLLRMQTTRTNENKSLVIANPSFGEPLELLAVNPKDKTNRRGRRGVFAARDLSETYFTPLGGTAEEARSIREQFSDAAFLTKDQATESALKKVNAPRILHIATHGFFLEDTETAKTTTRGANALGTIENPLVRSGLALAGANRRDGKPDDGILTALEASNLNLFGTKLVVLSACDTGVGEVKNGEGVYGLRRSFVLAGAESLVMSLWAVSDSETRRLMTNYYKNLKQGLGRGAALRQAQLEMLKRKDHEHPFYWAAFIQSGEWANLDGKR